jgi:hypothetical protein
VAEADRLIEAAAQKGACLQSATPSASTRPLRPRGPVSVNPRFIEVHRLGVFPERSLDIDVIFDLMIHDLDLLLAVVGSAVVSIEAVGVHVLTPRTDIAKRAAPVCLRLHRELDGEPHQP